MTEEFLQYIWKHALAGITDLRTSDGKRVEIIRPGIHNSDAGPDFFNAQLSIDGMRWAGNVEVHVRSSAWGQHKHQLDDAYKNVILHAVWDDDEPVFGAGGLPIPAIELKKYIPKDVCEKYTALRYSSKDISCESEIGNIDLLSLHSWMERLVAERLERKSDRIALKLNNTINNWEEVFYHTFFGNLGNPVNSQPFETLASAVPYKLLLKQKNDIFGTEALLFGQAGLLGGEFTEDYPKELQKEYLYMKHKFDLTPMQKSEWKFMRIRPLNFPTLRIAQASAIISEHAPLFRKIIEAAGINDIKGILSAEPSAYWQGHYNFGSPRIRKKGINKSSADEKTTSAIGDSTINMLIINAVVPILFMYGKRSFNEEMCRRAIDLLHKLKPEKNHITDEWKRLGITSADAYDSQALIELRKSYCDEKKCVRCAIGHRLMKKG